MKKEKKERKKNNKKKKKKKLCVKFFLVMRRKKYETNFVIEIEKKMLMDNISDEIFLGWQIVFVYETNVWRKCFCDK